MNNILFCSAGRRNTLLKDAKASLGGKGQVIATDVSPVAPALFDADKAFLEIGRASCRERVCMRV